ncbi:MAG: cyclic nucleotide-binding domain-containing protein [Acidobacteriota bacterium]
MLNKLFSRKKAPSVGDGKELTVEDLITLERYDEALSLLREKVKLQPKDLYSHLKIAEVYVALKDVTKAIDSYVYVADTMADDGFFDKGIALLAKASKLAPGNDIIPRRVDRLRRLKQLEKRRAFAIEGLKQNKTTDFRSAANSALEVEMLWNKIAKSHLMTRLDGEQITKLFSVMEMSKITEGSVLVKKHQQMQVMFLVVDGTIEAGEEDSGRFFDIKSFTTGDLIGEGALLERKVWPATYRVTESGTVFILNREGLEVAMQGHPDPRGFISVLRLQNHDRDVAANLQKLHKS